MIYFKGGGKDLASAAALVDVKVKPEGGGGGGGGNVRVKSEPKMLPFNMMGGGGHGGGHGGNSKMAQNMSMGAYSDMMRNSASMYIIFD